MTGKADLSFGQRKMTGHLHMGNALIRISVGNSGIRFAISTYKGLGLSIKSKVNQAFIAVEFAPCKYYPLWSFRHERNQRTS